MVTKEELKQLVIERIKILPEDTGISIGRIGNFDKQELIDHVASGDDVGEKIIEVELNFLRGLAV